MAHLWTQSASGWGVRKLCAALCALSESSPRPHAFARHPGDEQPGATGETATWLIGAAAGGSRVWALVASANCGVRVNGRAVLAGLCVLADRDEIRTSGAHYYFSTETLAAVEEFPTPERPVFCGRCRQQIEVGSPAVCCPGCGVWYNQSADLPCWTYADKCTFCGHSTALDAGFSWTPEE